ncbi:hypothetical protein HG536_0B06900 [Torulaspora globosa]|uniref:USP8 dimerisation domain-containing protein n=1 Tax=Torulaspora globosa TaxID=48254 RepID=A0A7G3ZE86_9SACH|nr:uncharacterized protein HG536_0B06900 [Torulaspora globosa]QLL31822.1 hypothetical protein HG536_0B06900 [Torulaspora globosa]
MKSTVELNNEALDYKFFPGTCLKVYLKACVGILEKAQLAFQNGDLQKSYVFYVRYVDLCTNKLSRHPEYLGTGSARTAETELHKQEYLQLIKLEVPAVLKISEDLRKEIDLEYSKHQLSLAKNIAKSRPQHKKETENQAPEPKKVPPTFDEHLFNRSVAYYRKATEKVKSSHASAESSSDSKQLGFYPDLPQLSFIT